MAQFVFRVDRGWLATGSCQGVHLQPEAEGAVKHRKVFRYRMNPTRDQRDLLCRMAGGRRFVWNWALTQSIAHYRENCKSLAGSELSRRLTALKQQPETAWLQDVDAQAMQQVLADLQRAYLNFFKKRARFPRFKSRKRDKARFRIPQRVKVADGRVYVPKVGSVAIRQSRQVDGETKSATFKRDATGKWAVTLVTEFLMPDTSVPPADPFNVVGIDLGLKEFAVLSDGERVPVPQFFRKAERKLRRAQRVFSRRKKGSARSLRARQKVALVHQKTANRRSDFLHNLTSGLVCEYEGICIEDLNVKGLAKTKLAKSVLDASFGEFRRQLEYKTVWNRRHLAVIDRWYPSSKTCHACGAINSALTLADRSWTCICGAHLDRDLNAALNIRTEGLKMLVAGYAESLNARGPDVRLPQLEAIGVEA
jgi:putative transposase